MLLTLCLGTCFAAFVLFAFNIMAVVSYPDLGPSGVEQHQLLGLMLLVTLRHGPGKLPLDHFLRRRFPPAAGR